MVSSGWSPPTSFDEYQLVQALGHGQMGHVYLAFDTVLARHVAVKFIASLEPDESARQRFLTEARAAARLQHPNVVTVYRVGLLGERPYIISEFVRGQTLETLPKPVPWTRALEIGIELARGLAAAHRKGVLHRDLKPANAILTEDGNAKLLDFGLAKLTEGMAAGGPPSSPPPSDPAEAVVPIHPETPPPAPFASIESSSTVGAPIDSRATAQLTRVGAVMGTPDYMSPEVWRGRPAARASDVYSLGALLYELCAGHSPFADVSLSDLPRAVQVRDAPPLAQAAPGVDARFAAIVDRCLRRDAASRFASGDEVREALERLASTGSGAIVPEGNPYRGLRPFEAEHRALFFGRFAETGVVLDRLRAEPFVLVTGESGVGKSSVCRAGVLPAVAEGALEGGRSWSVSTLSLGRQPLSQVAAALADRLGTPEAALGEAIRSDPTAVVYELRRGLGTRQGLVLFFDQLEDLVRLSDPEQAAAVDELLAQLVAGVPGVKVLATARADSLPRLAALSYFGGEVSRAVYILGPLGPDRLREVIVGPAEVTGTSFESEGLVDTLVESTAHADGGLPLLQFALAELWEARDPRSGMVTARALESLGGVAGALSRHGDAVLAALLPAQRAVSRRLLTRLVTAEGGRARRGEEELTGGDPAAREALDALVRGRLVVALEAEEHAAYEIAHEALISGWKTLRDPLHEDADRRVVRERVSAAAAEWERLGRGRETLWGERQLAEVARVGLSDLNPRERAFLGASRRAVRGARVARWSLIVGIPLLVAAVVGVVRLQAHLQLRQRVEANVARARVQLAEARGREAEVDSLRRAAFAHFDARERARGEEVWARALGLTAEVEQAYGGASQELEAALALDAQDEEVRGLLGDALLARSYLAERDHRTARRDELVQRLALYDPDGERLRRWNAPGTLSVESSPAGASVAIERYKEDSRGRLQPVRLEDLGTTPVRPAALPRGSYRLTFRLRGRATVRYPFLLARGERLHVAVDLPPASRIPAGFAYIPPGRFLFGSSAEDSLRRGFYDTLPVHKVLSRDYLIARREVTIGDWIEFLRALSGAERARRTPSVAALAGAMTAALRIDEQPDGSWRFTFRPGAQTYTARAGEPIRYAVRTRRAAQDWLRFPVTGVSAHDAEAYVAWLRSSGRVSGARLCTELEWERAARGADEREYPHGHRLEPTDANYDETYGKDPRAMGPDEVGSHPASRSPFDLDDLSGNAFEWTTSSLAAGQYVGRGGSYFYERNTNRVINRQSPTPTLRDPSLGLRVCATYSGR